MVLEDLRQLVVEMMELARPGNAATVSQDDVKQLTEVHSRYMHATRPVVVSALLDVAEADQRYRAAASRFAVCGASERELMIAHMDMERARKDQGAALARLTAL